MAAKAVVKARSADDFAAAHVRDVKVPNKIRAALAKMRDLGCAWEYESEMQRAPYSVAPVDFAGYRDLPEFKKHWFMTEAASGEKPRRVWWHDAKLAAKHRPKDQE